MCVTAVPAIGSPFPQRGKMKDEQTVTYHLYVATLPSWMSSSLASWAFAHSHGDGSLAAMVFVDRAP